MPRHKNNCRLTLTRSDATNLHHPQALQSLLYQFLHPPVLRLVLVLTEPILGPPTGVFAEVIVGELRRVAKERTELQSPMLAGLSFPFRRPLGEARFLCRTYQRSGLESRVALYGLD